MIEAIYVCGVLGLFTIFLFVGTGRTTHAPSFIISNLLQGGAEVLNDSTFFNKWNIKYVLSLGRLAPSDSIMNSLKGHKTIDKQDIPSSRLSKDFEELISFIHNARIDNLARLASTDPKKRDEPADAVYIHCAAGISRSSTATCAYLMCIHDLTLKKALLLTVIQRPIAFPNEGFVMQLVRWEKNKKERQVIRDSFRAAHPRHAELVQKDLEEIDQILKRKTKEHTNRVNAILRSVRLYRKDREARLAAKKRGASPKAKQGYGTTNQGGKTLAELEAQVSSGKPINGKGGKR